MKIQINKSTNIEAALNIASENQHFFNSHGLEMMEKDFMSGLLIYARSENKALGFISFKEINDQVVELAWMAVVPKYQNQGIGTILIKEGLKLLSKSYLLCVVKTLSEIDPDKEFAKTRNFYKKCGFIPLETINPYPAWGEDNPCQFFVKIIKHNS